jgi:signal transduction histidine kinase
MKRRLFPDSIAWWFALNVVAAILATVLMNLAFVQFAGVWALPPLEDAGLLDQVAGIARTMDKLPAAERGPLAEALASPAFDTHWYARREQVPASLHHSRHAYSRSWWPRLAGMLGRADARVLVSDPDDEPASGKYGIAIELSDHSWIAFDTARRSWGLNRGARMLLGALFILLSSAIVASIASRRLAWPVQRFARAAEKFGSGQRAEPLKLVGPLEIRDAAAAFNAMQERIQRLVESRTEMLTAISHDLRAPLTRMRLRGEFVDDVEQQRKLFRDVDEMQAMLEASLAFFRLDAQQEEAPTRLELGELVQSVLDDFRDLGRPVAAAGLRPLVYLGRPLALRRALTNLVDNALKYGTTATVTLAAGEREVVIHVDDDGPGVPPVLLPKLFQPFFRAEPSRSRATGGFGLGLASAQSIVRGHGGELSLSNRRPFGLRATIVLPVAN